MRGGEIAVTISDRAVAETDLHRRTRIEPAGNHHRRPADHAHVLTHTAGQHFLDGIPET